MPTRLQFKPGAWCNLAALFSLALLAGCNGEGMLVPPWASVAAVTVVTRAATAPVGASTTDTSAAATQAATQTATQTATLTAAPVASPATTLTVAAAGAAAPASSRDALSALTERLNHCIRNVTTVYVAPWPASNWDPVKADHDQVLPLNSTHVAGNGFRRFAYITHAPRVIYILSVGGHENQIGVTGPIPFDVRCN